MMMNVPLTISSMMERAEKEEKLFHGHMTQLRH